MAVWSLSLIHGSVYVLIEQGPVGTNLSLIKFLEVLSDCEGMLRIGLFCDIIDKKIYMYLKLVNPL